MKNVFKFLSSKLIVVVLMFSMTGAKAAELNLADEPLFLGISTDPNVFFQMDDSGSMDWEVMTKPYYLACQYDRDAAGNSGNSDCNDSQHTDGLWSVYSGNNDRRGRAIWSNFAYIYKESDNAYDTNCTGWISDVQSCGIDDAFSYDWRGGSSDFNVIYFDPKASYSAWAGTGLQPASFASARSNPQPEIAAVASQVESDLQVARPAQSAKSETDGYDDTRDLSGFVYYVWVDSHGIDTTLASYPRRGSNINRKAFEDGDGVVDYWDNYYKYTVNESSVDWQEIKWDQDGGTGSITENVVTSGSFSGAATDPNTTVVPARTVAEIQQNIANWYSYARRRSFVVKGAVGAVVSSSPSFRFGQTLINDSSTLFDEVPPSTVTKYSGYNQVLLNDLYSHQWRQRGTPLRKGLDKAGSYFSGNLNAEYSIDVADPIIQSCQQNFTVLFTDGYWNDDPPSWSGGDHLQTVDEVDTLILDKDGDGLSITVADVARFYYSNDLSDLTDNVVPNIADPAEYQHMVTFPVAFGVSGSLVDSDGDGWPNPVLDVNDTWGNSPFGNDQGKIDDLWHAAFNSAGEYVSAQTPQEVVSSLTSALSEISSRDAASASVATSTGQISAATAVYQAQFNSGDWSGRLYSFALNDDDSVDVENPNWQAGTLLDAQDFDSQRTVITNNGSRGVKFRFPSSYLSPTVSEISSGQLPALLADSPNDLTTADTSEITENQEYGEAFVNYLRGDRSNEGVSNGEFRPRSSVLGDIVDSDPKYVSKPNFYYPDSLETASYAAFRSTYLNRTPVVYVGSNGGMLHGFNAENGQELFSYVPSAVFKNLHVLTNPAYSHKFFVNGAPTIVDAFYSGSWHTVLAGALGRGGQSIFALDVTNPAQFDESNADSLFLWEFDDSDDADLGYTFSEPSIAKMEDGRWVAIFGNGYNNTEADGNASTTGHAVLYIVDVGTGALIKKIDTGIGSIATPNGLATPALVDVNNDYIVDYVYAGDLYGNMWKFDVTSSNPVSWDVAWVNGADKKPLFTTASGQSITTRPSVGLHQEGDGVMVYFGTGKYIEKSDNNSVSEPDQSFYGIWDKHESSASGLPVLPSELLLQTIDHEFSATFSGNAFRLRITSDNAPDWSSHEGWKIDLVNRNLSPVDNNGERQVSDAILRNGRIIFPTNLPSDTPCTPGGTSWLMELDAADGSRLDEAPFDLNNDGIFSELDYTYSADGIPDVPTSGVQSQEGIITTPGILRDVNREVKYLSGSTGVITNFSESTGAENVGRQSWRELE